MDNDKEVIESALFGDEYDGDDDDEYSELDSVFEQVEMESEVQDMSIESVLDEIEKEINEEVTEKSEVEEELDIIESALFGDEADNESSEECSEAAKELLEREYIKIPETGIGDISDGYHTFNELYHQRAILFATIVNQNPDKAWKSFKHEDGKYCFDSNGEWFIVGIDTPEGGYTYHYSKEYWDLFKCEELPVGKHWDGHTEKDVKRLLSLA